MFVGVGPARKFFIQFASAMIQGASRKQAQAAGTSRKQVLGWDPPTSVGATLCHIDKMFLDLGPTFSNSCARNMLMKFKDLGSFIKFYGARTEGLLQDESIVGVSYVKANLMR